MLVFGPAYLDFVVDIDRPLVDDPKLRLDQSLPALQAMPRADGLILLEGPTGDRLAFPLPTDAQEVAATYTLAEPVLARRLGAGTRRVVSGTYPVSDYRAQLGGMGAGYALALHGILRMPLGRDEMGRQILRLLDVHGVQALPHYLACATDTSLLILSSYGDKLAVGVRDAMVRWRAAAEDRALVEHATALVFCGAPNVLAAEVLSWNPDLPVLYAPAMRNVLDTGLPLAELAPYIDYLSLNALEWEHLDGKARCRAEIPVISVTDGPFGSRILLHDEELFVPAVPCEGEINTNRAGETYAATFFTVLLRDAPGFLRTGQVDRELVRRAGELAARQAARQLHISGFAFPPDDGVE